MRLRGIEGRRVVVLMTDGRDENNPGTGPGSVHGVRRRARAAAERRRHRVHHRARKQDRSRAAASAWRSESGGEAAFPEDVSLLPQEFRRILENLRRRYVISYTSTNSTRDGAWRKVDIRSRRHGVTVASRGGYFAPAQ